MSNIKKCAPILPRILLHLNRRHTAVQTRTCVQSWYIVQRGFASNKSNCDDKSTIILNKVLNATSNKESEVDPELKSAVQEVARSFPKLHQDKVAWELLKKLQEHKKVAPSEEGEKEGSKSVSSLLSGVQVQKRKPVEGARQRAGQDAQEGRAVTRRRKSTSRMEPGLFEGEALGIFPSELPKTEVSSTRTLFEELAAEEFKRKFTYPPAGVWEEQIRWTQEGKMWSFPITNEEGLEAEQHVPFTHHIFFDHLLKLFPSKGPIRHFMELVCVGLSKNAFLTVEQKHEHIKWFAQYFDEKKDIIEQATLELEASKEENKEKAAEAS